MIGIPVGVEGSPARPDELFDPRTQLLCLVFAGERVFPVGRSASATWLQVWLVSASKQCLIHTRSRYCLMMVGQRGFPVGRSASATWLGVRPCTLFILCSLSWRALLISPTVYIYLQPVVPPTRALHDCLQVNLSQLAASVSWQLAQFLQWFCRS